MRFRSESLRPVWIGGAVGLLAALAFAGGVFGSWSDRVTDRFFLPHAADPSITVVAIDDASINQIGRWPWPRTVHADLIRKLTNAGAKVIGYDVNFPEASTSQDDQALVAALRESNNVVLPVELTLTGSVTFDSTRVLSPMTQFASVAASTGHSNTPPDADGVVRRVPLSVTSHNWSDSMPAFVAEVARLAGKSDALAHAPTVTSFSMQTPVAINFAGTPFHAFREISAVDVLRGRADLSAIAGGVVFVGSTASDLHDALLVPTSDGVPMPGVEIHASLYNTLIQQRWLVPAPTWAIMLFLVVFGLFIGVLVSKVRARISVPLVIGAWVLVFVVAFFLFDRGVIVDVVWPTLVAIFAYAAVTLERRVTADRQRRQMKTVLTRYVSPAVVESILNDPSKMKLGGERRRMTVIFSDIRGFTTISEGLTPEQLVHYLNIYLSRMTDIVFAHEGVLDKYIGDAVMAFWNAPFDQADHAVRAVRTALAWQDALAEMNAKKMFGTLEFHIGAGVNTGDMIVGNVGGDARFDYTVIGDNVNLGSRLEGLTKEYGVRVLVSEATQKEIVKDILTRKLDKVAVKGKKEPVVIYEAMEELATASDARKQLAVDFEAALEAYFSRNFADAIARCEAIQNITPDDGPTKLLVERAKHFIETPPPADWVGTWVYTKK